MAHVRLEWAYEVTDERQIVVVQFLAGPAPRAIRPVGELQMHPAELNALDRLLSRGAVFESPANTYAIVCSDYERGRRTQARGLREHLETKLIDHTLARR